MVELERMEAIFKDGASFLIQLRKLSPCDANEGGN